MLLGSHCSISGGYVNALVEAKRLSMDAIQIFTKNQRFWKEKEVTEEEGKAFRKAMKEYGVKQVFSHAIYLISLGTDDEVIREKSILSLAAEFERCKAMGLTHTVVHPGAAGKLTEDEAIARIGTSIKEALEITKGNPVKLLLENTAGQGSSIGWKMEHIGKLAKYIKSPRIGMCLDTCHAFAAGYDIRTTQGIKDLLGLIDEQIGIDKLLCFHLNDSKGALGSRIDRHANIGEGAIGVEPFAYIMRNFPHIPKVLETKKDDDADIKNLSLLRSFVKQ
jgi:deoxyribonuclease IV